MLERLPSCLESGGRLLRASERRIPSKRRLHCAFWHHGAGGLNLPVGWASLAASVSGMADNTIGQSCAQPAKEKQTGHSTSMLEFLYPPHTMAYMRTLSPNHWVKWESRRSRRRKTTSGRHFSSISEDRNEKEETETAAEVQSILSQYHQNDPLAALKQLMLSDRKRANFELSWQFYEELDPSNRTALLAADLVDFLRHSTRLADADRILSIYDTIDVEYRRSSTFHAAITSALKIRMAGRAVEIHEEAVAQSKRFGFGTDILLARLIYDRQWDLAFRIYSAYVHFTTTHPKLNPDRVFDYCQRIPNLVVLLEDLLTHTGSFQEQYAATGKLPIAQSFVRGCTEAALAQLPSTSPYSDHKWQSVFEHLKRQGLSNKHDYEKYILIEMEEPRNTWNLSRRLLPWKLYLNYMEQAKSRSTPNDFIPSKRFMHLVLNRYCRYHYEKVRDTDSRPQEAIAKFGNDKTIVIRPPGFNKIRPHDYHYIGGDVTEPVITAKTIARDWTYFYGSLDEHYLTQLAELYSKYGGSTEVLLFTNELIKLGPLDRSNQVRLLRAYSNSANARGCQEQFDRLQAELGIAPTSEHYSILIGAYTRVRDLDTALKKLEENISLNSYPRKASFEFVTRLASEAGDVNMVYKLLKKAQDYKIDTNARTFRTIIIHAHINDGNIEAAEREARDFTDAVGQDFPRHELTWIWNPLLVHFAQTAQMSSMARMYQVMQENDIPLDIWGYSAIIRSLISLRLPDQAFKVLRKAMHAARLRPRAFHYSLVVLGYIRTRQPEKALEVYRIMLKVGIAETSYSKRLYIRARAALEMKAMRSSGHGLEQVPVNWATKVEGFPIWANTSSSVDYQRNLSPDQRLQEFLSDIEEVRASMTPQDNLPGPRLETPAGPPQAVPEAYFQSLVMIYGTQRSFELIKDLFDTLVLSDDPSSHTGHEPSLKLLASTMDSYRADRDHGAVERCWNLARAYANRLLGKTSLLESPSRQSDNLATKETDGIPTARGDLATMGTNERTMISDDKLPQEVIDFRDHGIIDSLPIDITTFIAAIPDVPEAARRRVLAQCAQNYIRSLKDQRKSDEAIAEFLRLVLQGYIMSNDTWNMVIEMLSQSGRPCEAFSLCEQYLMPRFIRWYKVIPPVWEGGPSYRFMKTRRSERKGPYGHRPKYRTMIFLAKELMRARDPKSAHYANPDTPPSPHEAHSHPTPAELNDLAPLTVKALDEMPLVSGDELQAEHLGVRF